MSFSVALWLAIFLNFLGTELYLTLTPAQSNRLRVVSCEKQMARGMKRPGSAGLVVERWGHADEWVPRAEEKQVD